MSGEDLPRRNVQHPARHSGPLHVEEGSRTFCFIALSVFFQEFAPPPLLNELVSMQECAWPGGFFSKDDFPCVFDRCCRGITSVVLTHLPASRPWFLFARRVASSETGFVCSPDVTANRRESSTRRIPVITSSLKFPKSPRARCHRPLVARAQSPASCGTATRASVECLLLLRGGSVRKIQVRTPWFGARARAPFSWSSFNCSCVLRFRGT